MKVNALGVASRSVPEVKNKWNNMIQKAKKDNTEFVTKARATGGGPPLSPISSRIVDRRCYLTFSTKLSYFSFYDS